MESSFLQSLRGKAYEEIEKALKQLKVKDILFAIDDRSTRIGDTAAELLATREEFGLIGKALLNDALKTANGRLRASHVLERRGSACETDILVYEHLLEDRSEGVVSNALFGLVFFPSPKSIPRMKSFASDLPEGSTRRNLFEKAIDAIVKQDSSIYAPGFTDAANVWRASSTKK